jgi:hypothetical protein
MGNYQLAGNNPKYFVQINSQLIKNQGQKTRTPASLAILSFKVKRVYTIPQSQI